MHTTPKHVFLLMRIAIDSFIKTCQQTNSYFCLFSWQEQPLLLEDLLEQEKREQARHTGSNQIEQIMPSQSQQSILNDMV